MNCAVMLHNMQVFHIESFFQHFWRYFADWKTTNNLSHVEWQIIFLTVKNKRWLLMVLLHSNPCRQLKNMLLERKINVLQIFTANWSRRLALDTRGRLKYVMTTTICKYHMYPKFSRVRKDLAMACCLWFWMALFEILVWSLLLTWTHLRILV